MADDEEFNEKVFENWDKGGPRVRLVPPAGQDDAEPGADASQGKDDDVYVFHAARLPDPAKIRPRRWLYGTQLIRGHVTVLVAPGGTGKSSYSIGVALALVTGTALLGEHVYESVKVSVVNLDDDTEELDRRVAAMMIKHGIQRDEVAGRLFLDDGSIRRLTIAAPSPDGFKIIYPDERPIIKGIRASNIGLIIVDPFAESHTLEENSPSEMIKAAAAWRRVARATGCAVLLVHHVRKGAANSIDDARGAKAVTDSARVGLLMLGMTESEAEAFEVDPEECGQYSRVAEAKRNMAPAQKAKWLKLESVPLGNISVDPLYPKGDNVQAIVRWMPPSPLQRFTPAELNRVLDLIAERSKTDQPCGRHRSGKSKRWVGLVLVNELGLDEGQAEYAVSQWFKNGLLVERSHYDNRQGREQKGVHVVDAQRPTMSARAGPPPEQAF